jgi:spore coat polysaccharide biosynthesis protein SpsF
MNEQQNFWANQYAEEYIMKNSKFDQTSANECWKNMLKDTENIKSILECGCNIGRNLHSLNLVLPLSKKSVIEISKPAFEYVSNEYSLSQAYNGSIEDSNLVGSFDLVFTMGVLIHIHPDDLIKNMKKIYDYSSKYILIGEYFNRTPVMIEYQGEKNKLFKCDFGKLFLDNFKVKLLNYGFIWGNIYDNAGFDDITWWMFEKS